MTKKILSLAWTVLSLALVACDGSEYEMHQTYLNKSSVTCYADQTTDTLSVFSYDSWSLTTNDTWYSVSQTGYTVPDGYFANIPVVITMPANTTGENRSGTITVKESYDNQEFVASVYQYGWLNIITPNGTITGSTDQPFKEWKKTFSVSLKHSTTSYSIKFQTYADGATLTSDAEWVVPETTTFATKGIHTVALTLTPNTGDTARTATITLTSNGVSTPITITQQAEAA